MSLTLLLLACLLGLGTAQRYQPTWSSIDSRPLPQWYDEAKVGIFIHWGVFSVPSYLNEWFWDWWINKHDPRIISFMEHNYPPNFTYPQFAAQFTAEFFEPQRWAKLFAQSGARYVVLTTKHHEGYTLWPSKYSFNWNAGDVGPKRDLVGEVAKAVRAEGLRFGTYHSWFEWFNPLYLNDKKNGFATNDFVTMKARPELEELIAAYEPDVIWSDGDGEASDVYWNSTNFLAWLYNDSPVKDKVVTNDRYGMGMPCHHGGFFSCDDRYNPGVLQPHKWENAMTLDGASWGYRRDAVLSDYLTPNQLLSTLVQTIACGGNILINVGPTKEGTIIPVFEERLLQLGDWLRVNGQAVYKSRPWQTCQNDSMTEGIWYTKGSSGAVYAFLLNAPVDDQVFLACVNANSLKSVELLGVPQAQLRFAPRLGGTVVVASSSAYSQLKFVPTLKFVFV